MEDSDGPDFSLQDSSSNTNVFMEVLSAFLIVTLLVSFLGNLAGLFGVNRLDSAAQELMQVPVTNTKQIYGKLLQHSIVSSDAQNTHPNMDRNDFLHTSPTACWRVHHTDRELVKYVAIYNRRSPLDRKNFFQTKTTYTQIVRSVSMDALYRLNVVKYKQFTNTTITHLQTHKCTLVRFSKSFPQACLNENRLIYRHQQHDAHKCVHGQQCSVNQEFMFSNMSAHCGKNTHLSLLLFDGYYDRNKRIHLVISFGEDKISYKCQMKNIQEDLTLFASSEIECGKIRQVLQERYRNNEHSNNIFCLSCDLKVIRSYETIKSWIMWSTGDCLAGYQCIYHDYLKPNFRSQQSETDPSSNTTSLLPNHQIISDFFNILNNSQNNQNLLTYSSYYSSLHMSLRVSELSMKYITRLKSTTSLTDSSDSSSNSFVYRNSCDKMSLTNVHYVQKRQMKQRSTVPKLVARATMYKSNFYTGDMLPKSDRENNINYLHIFYKCKQKENENLAKQHLPSSSGTYDNCNIYGQQKQNNKNVRRRRLITYKQYSDASLVSQNVQTIFFCKMKANHMRTNLNTNSSHTQSDSEDNTVRMCVSPHASNKVYNINNPFLHSFYCSNKPESNTETAVTGNCKSSQPSRGNNKLYHCINSLSLTPCQCYQLDSKDSEKANENSTRHGERHTGYETNCYKTYLFQNRVNVDLHKSNCKSTSPNKRERQITTKPLRNINMKRNNKSEKCPDRQEKSQQIRNGDKQRTDVEDKHVTSNHKVQVRHDQTKDKQHKRSLSNETCDESSYAMKPLSRRYHHKNIHVNNWTSLDDKNRVCRDQVLKHGTRSSNVEQRDSLTSGYNNLHYLRHQDYLNTLSPSCSNMEGCTISFGSTNPKIRNSSKFISRALVPEQSDKQSTNDQPRHALSYSLCPVHQWQSRLSLSKDGCSPINKIPTSTYSNFSFFTELEHTPLKYITTNSLEHDSSSSSSSTETMSSYTFHNSTQLSQNYSGPPSGSTVILDINNKERYVNDKNDSRQGTEKNMFGTQEKLTNNKKYHKFAYRADNRSRDMEEHIQCTPRKTCRHFNYKDNSRCPSGVNHLVSEHVLNQHPSLYDAETDTYACNANSHSQSYEYLPCRKDRAYSNSSGDSSEDYMNPDKKLIILRHSRNDVDELSENSTSTQTTSLESLYLAQILSSSPTHTVFSDSNSRSNSRTYIDNNNLTQQTVESNSWTGDTGESECQLENYKLLKPSVSNCTLNTNYSWNRTSNEETQNINKTPENNSPFYTTNDPCCWCSGVPYTSLNSHHFENKEVPRQTNHKLSNKINSTPQSKARVRFKTVLEEPDTESDESLRNHKIPDRHKHKRSCIKSHNSQLFNTFTDIHNSSSDSQIHTTEKCNTSEETFLLTNNERGRRNSKLSNSNCHPCGRVDNSLRTDCRCDSTSRDRVSEHTVSCLRKKATGDEDASPQSVLFDSEHISYMEMIPKKGACRGFRLSEMDASEVSKILSAKASTNATTLKNNTEDSNFRRRRHSRHSSATSSVSPVLYTIKSLSPHSTNNISSPVNSDTSPSDLTASTNTTCSFSSIKETVSYQNPQTLEQPAEKTTDDTQTNNDIFLKFFTQPKKTSRTVLKRRKTAGDISELADFPTDEISHPKKRRRGRTELNDADDFKERKIADSTKPTNDNFSLKLLAHPKMSSIPIFKRMKTAVHTPDERVYYPNNDIISYPRNVSRTSPELDTSDGIHLTKPCSTKLKETQSVQTATDISGLLFVDCISSKTIDCLSNQTTYKPTFISLDKQVSCNIQEDNAEKNTQTSSCENIKCDVGWNKKVSAKNILSMTGRHRTQKESSEEYTDESIVNKLIPEIVQPTKQNVRITKYENALNHQTEDIVTKLDQIIDYTVDSNKETKTERCDTKNSEEDKDPGIFFKLMLNSKPNCASSIKLEKRYNPTDSSSLHMQDLIQALKIIGDQRGTYFESPGCERESQNSTTVGPECKFLHANSTRFELTDNDITYTQEIAERSPVCEILPNHKHQKQVQFSDYPTTMKNVPNAKCHSPNMTLSSDQQNLHKSVTSMIPSSTLPCLRQEDIQVGLDMPFHNHTTSNKEAHFTSRSPKKCSTSLLHLNKHTNREVCLNNQKILTLLQRTSEQEAHSISTVRRCRNTRYESMDNSVHKVSSRLAKSTEAFPITTRTCDNCYTSDIRNLPVATNQSSYIRYVTDAANKTLENRYMHAAANETLENIYMPAVANQTLENRYMPAAANQTLENRYMPAAANQTLENRYMPASTNQTLENRYIPASTNQTLENRYMPAPTNRALENRYLPKSMNQIAETRYQPSTANQTSDTRYIPSTASKTSYTRYIPSTANQTSDTRYMPSAAYQTSDTRYMTSTANQTADTRYMPSTANQTSDTRYIDPTANQMSDTIYIPSTANQTSDTRYIPSTTNQTSDTRYRPSTINQTSDTRYIPSTANQTSDTRYIPSIANQTSDTRYIPSTANQTSDTRYMASAANQTSETLYMPTPHIQTSNARCVHATSCKTSTSYLPVATPQAAKTVCLPALINQTSDKRHLLPSINQTEDYSHLIAAINQMSENRHLPTSTNEMLETRYIPTATNQTSDIRYEQEAPNQTSDIRYQHAATNQTSDIRYQHAATNQTSDIRYQHAATNQTSDIRYQHAATNQASETRHLPAVINNSSETRHLPAVINNTSETRYMPAVINNTSETRHLPAVINNTPETRHLPAVINNTSEARHLPAVINKPSETRYMPAVTEQTSETRHLPAVINNTSEARYMPAVTEQTSETRYLSDATDPTSETRYLPAAIYQTSETRYLPAAINQTSETRYLPASRNNASENRYLPSVKNHTSETRYIDTTRNEIFEQRYLATLNNHILETRYIALPTNKTSETRYFAPPNKKTLEARYFARPNNHILESRYFAGQSNKTSESRYLPVVYNRTSETRQIPFKNKQQSEMRHLPVQSSESSLEKTNPIITCGLDRTNLLFTGTRHVKSKIPVPTCWKSRKSLLSSVCKRQLTQASDYSSHCVTSTNISPTCSPDYEQKHPCQYFNNNIILLSPPYKQSLHTNCKQSKTLDLTSKSLESESRSGRSSTVEKSFTSTPRNL